MNKNIKLNFEKLNNSFSILPEINFAWSKGHYFFIFVGWLKYRTSYKFL